MFEFHWFDAHFFEMLFLIFFAISWPSAIIKSIRSKTARGKSLMFSLFAICAYSCGITSKLIDANLSYTLFFYIFNLCLVITDVILYIINSRRDRRADAAAKLNSQNLATLVSAEDGAK